MPYDATKLTTSELLDNYSSGIQSDVEEEKAYESESVKTIRAELQRRLDAAEGLAKACEAVMCQHDAYQQKMLPEIEKLLRDSISAYGPVRDEPEGRMACWVDCECGHSTNATHGSRGDPIVRKCGHCGKDLDLRLPCPGDVILWRNYAGQYKPAKEKNKLERRIDATDGLAEACEYASELIGQLPSIDIDAREDDPSPEDTSAHIGGLIIRRLESAIAAYRESLEDDV